MHPRGPDSFRRARGGPITARAELIVVIANPRRWTQVTNSSAVILAALVVLALAAPAQAGFGGYPPLGPKDSLRRLLAPYDLAKLNYLGMNYCENLLDSRTNITSYTHLGSDSPTSDAWHLQFPDDSARLLEGIAWEDQFSPVVRLELARRIAKGIIAAHIPGTQGYYSFRHRNAGKTFLIFDQEAPSGDGRLTVSNWGDAIEGHLKVGFGVRKGSEWLEIDRFKFADDPPSAGNPSTARSARYWNESPFVFHRRYTLGADAVDYTGRYWFSDEDTPLELAFSSRAADELRIVVGEPGKAMTFMTGAPGTILLPDRKTSYSSASDGDLALARPAFNYIILRKETAWASPGYSTALLVMWKGRPSKLEALAENGYGQIRLSYERSGAEAAGKVWVLPFQWVNRFDMAYIYRNAESFLKHGRLIHNGFPTMQLENAIPSGLAAAAYLLTRYDDPSAPTVRAHAKAAVDELLDAQKSDQRLLRGFFAVRVAAWMAKLGREMRDEAMVSHYTSLLGNCAKVLLSPESGYDGKGWPGGWDHFNSAKSVWLAYDATGNPDYLHAYERALEVYTIDEKGIYRYGKPMEAPGGFDTYFGSMPMGIWGHAGKLDWVDKLINLDPPNQTPGSVSPKHQWNDSGVGPWAQDDANPEYVGLCLKGLNIPTYPKHVIPLGSFPIYGASGKVTLTRQPIVANPFFPRSIEKEIVQKPGQKITHKVSTLVIRPGEADAAKYAVGSPASDGKCAGREALVYRFSTKGATGAGADLRIKGDGYRVELSPDGKRWFQRLDTWNEGFAERSVDASFLTGCRDELVKLLTITPPDDKTYLQTAGQSKIEREHCRSVAAGGSFVYKLNLRDVVDCHLEIVAGSGCKLECSPDGKAWRSELTPDPAASAVDPDAAWVRFVDVSKYLKGNPTLYLRFSSDRSSKGACLRRLVAYGAIDSDSLWVRVSNVEDSVPHSFTVDQIAVRTWTR